MTYSIRTGNCRLIFRMGLCQRALHRAEQFYDYGVHVLVERSSAIERVDAAWRRLSGREQLPPPAGEALTNIHASTQNGVQFCFPLNHP